MNKKPVACHPERIELFLGQQLSVEEQSSFELHLDECSDCRQRLEATAASEDIWSGVRDSFLPETNGTAGLRMEHATFDPAMEDECSFSHESVLSLLAPTDDDRMIGRLGTYEVVGVIGSGGMGVVLKAFDSALNRYVAIKVLAPHLGSSGAARKRFLREAQAAAAVVHDNVIEIHSVAQAAGLPYLVMPYVRGPSLQRRLDQDGPLAVVEILRISMQAAAGLAAAHAQGLIHRDVKPANILLADGIERVKLTDFGLARAADDASLTKTGIIAGTPQYMSPEQARGEAVDQRSDLFSLGSVLYAMCTGRAPFRAETSYGVLRRVTDEEPRPIRELNPEIPEWLCRIVTRLMSKLPGDRFDSAYQVAGLLEDCLAHVQQPAAIRLPAEVMTQPKRRRFLPISRRLLGVVTMIAAVGMSLLGMMLWQASEPPDITGNWTSEALGVIRLEAKQPGQYDGSYSDSGDLPTGSLNLDWSRLERRFNGTWSEGTDRNGTLSLRVVGDEIRGAWATDVGQSDRPGRPRLFEFSWRREDVLPPADSPSAAATPAATQLPAPIQAPERILRFDNLTIGHGIRIAVSADGSRIAVANGNPSIIHNTSQSSTVADNWKPTVDILDAETGKAVASLRLTDDEEDGVIAATEAVTHVEATAVGFSPDGKVLAVGTNIGQVKLFDTQAGELLRSFDDERAKVADPMTPEEWKTLPRAIGRVESLAFSPDGSQLAICGPSFADFAECFDRVSRLGFRVTGPGRLKLWDVQTGKLEHDLAGHNDQAYAVAFSPDGTMLASAGRWLAPESLEFGNGVIIWNAQTGEPIHSLIRTNANAGVRAIAFSPDSNWLVLGTQRFGEGDDEPSSGGVSLVRVASGIEKWLVTVPGWAQPLAFLPEEQSIAVLCGGRLIRFLNVEDGNKLVDIQLADGQDVRWHDFAIASQTGALAIGGVDKAMKGSVEVWRTRNNAAKNSAPLAGAEVFRNFTTDARVKTIACSENGELIAIANAGPTLVLQTDGTSRVKEDWKPSTDILDAKTGELIASLQLTTEDEETVLAATERVSHFEVDALAMSHDSKLVAVGTSIGQVKLFDARTGELVRSLKAETYRLADDKVPSQWYTLVRAMGSVRSIAFSPDGNLLATCGGSTDDFARAFDSVERRGERTTGPGRLKVWDLRTGKLKYDLVGHSHVNQVAFSPDGTMLASAGSWLSDSNAGTGVILWKTLTGEKLRSVGVDANGGTHAVAFSHDNRRVAIGSLQFDKDSPNAEGTRVVRLVRVASGIVEWQRAIPGIARPLGFLQDGGSDAAVVVLHGGRDVRYLDLETGSTLMEIGAQFADEEGFLSDFVMARQGLMHVFGGVAQEGHGTVHVWDFAAPDAGPPVPPVAPVENKGSSG